MLPAQSAILIVVVMVVGNGGDQLVVSSYRRVQAENAYLSASTHL
jgi:hypothetical protein